MCNKIGGAPYSIQTKFDENKCLIIGADVYHERNKKSYAALVSQFGKGFLNRYSNVQFQKNYQEIIKGVGQMVIQHIENAKKTFKLPEKIIFYRDGVGEGQQSEVIRTEVKDILSTLKDTYKLQQPSLTYVIVTKRIEDRFGVLRQGRLENPFGGLIVQDKVVKDEIANFFMVAQKVNQGTATPTHYQVVIDQNSLKLEDLQILTYHLCYFYFNWNGPVKVPSVCQYAHKLAYLQGLLQDNAISKKLVGQYYYL